MTLFRNRYRLGLLIIAFISLLATLLPSLMTVWPAERETRVLLVQRVDGPTTVGENGALCRAIEDGDLVQFELTGYVRSLGGYQNLFQTDDLNSGLRFEFDTEGRGALVVGIAGVAGFDSIPLMSRLEVGPFQIIAQVQGKNFSVASDSDVGNTKRIDDAVVSCELIKVGVGYDDSRVADAKIELTVKVQDTSMWLFPQRLESALTKDIYWFITRFVLITCIFLFVIAVAESRSTLISQKSIESPGINDDEQAP